MLASEAIREALRLEILCRPTLHDGGSFSFGAAYAVTREGFYLYRSGGKLEPATMLPVWFTLPWELATRAIVDGEHDLEAF